MFRRKLECADIEKRQLEKSERLEPALAFYMIVAWRVLFLTMLGRACPEMPCDVVFDTAGWHAVYSVTARKPPSDTPPSLDQMVRMVAGLGGFLGRTSDGFPGPQTLWIGLQRAADFVLAMAANAASGWEDMVHRQGYGWVPVFIGKTRIE